MHPDARIRYIAERQRGHVTRRQLREAGLTDKQIHYRVTRGELVRVLSGVFRLRGVPESFEGRLQAASLWMGAGGCFTGTTAAYLLGVDVRACGRPSG